MADGMTRRDALSVTATGLIAGIGTGCSAAPAPPAATGTATLREIADGKGLYVGSAVTAADLAAQPKLRAVLRRDANMLVPENELKWSLLQPTRDGPLDFAAAERIYAFAKANRMAMRGHCLTWYRAEPDWARALVPTLTPAAAGDMLQAYVRAVVGHWRGRIVQWDVANEPVVADGSMPERLWSEKLGERYIDLAFAAAREADPDATLFVNQTLIEQDDWYIGAQATRTLRLLERLLKRGVPVQGLGIEGHLQTRFGFDERRWRTYLDQVTGLGLALMVTEFDVDDGGTSGTIAARDAASTALARAFLDTTLSYRQCRGVLTWGVTDDASWLNRSPDRARADGAPLRPDLRDADYRRKPMWQAMADALAGAPARGPKPVQ